MARRNTEAFEAPDPADEQPVHAETETAAPLGDPAAIDVDLTIKAKDETIAAREWEIEALHGTIAKKNETIASLEESFKAQGETIDAYLAQVKEKNDEIAELKRDLGMARLAVKSKASSAPAGIETLPGGGIRLAVELDVDESAPLLSWADSAGEDPATYIARTIKDSLVMTVSS